MLRIKKALYIALLTIFYQGVNAQLSDTLRLASLYPDSLEKTEGRVIHQTLVLASDFNQGHITDPLQLLQGKSSSLLIARTGNAPNGRFDFRMRGIKSFDVTEPLLIIDGMPVSSLDGIHPNDIASVEILKNGAGVASYGIRGGNGVLSIKTKRGEAGKTRIEYQTYRASERLVKKPEMLNAAGFRSIGGYDLGSSTDWWEEITRKAISQRHSFSLSGGMGQGGYYASLNFDDVNGIALGSAYKRYNGRFSFEQKALSNRLIFSGSVASTYRKSNLTPLIAFWHATSYNPTAPVYSEEEEFDQYGGYYEYLIFRNYNPVSLLEQNEFIQEYQSLLLQLHAKLELAPDLFATVQYGNQGEDLGNNIFFPGTSFYIGRHRNGFAQKTEAKNNNSYFLSSLTFSREWENIQLEAALQYRYQDISFQILDVQGGDFLTDAFSYHNLSAANDFNNDLGEVNTSKELHTLRGFSSHIDMVVKDKFFLSANLTREGSSRLGPNKKWGLFYGVNAGVRLNDQLSLRTAYSKTGNLPSRNFFAQELYEENYYFHVDGEFIRDYVLTQEGNPDLQWEETKEWSLGIDFKLWNNRLNGSIDYYTSRSDELIMQLHLDVPPHLGYRVFRNVGAVRNSGLEYNLNYQLFSKSNFGWQIGITGTMYARTRLLDYIYRWDDDMEYVGILGGGCDFPVIRLKRGEPLGEIWGYKLHPTRKVSPDGSWNRIDQNNDGYFSREDYVLVGNALPKWSLGITNGLNWGRFRIDFMLRGVFGHDLINHIKSFHSTPTIVSAYNVLREAKTELRDLQDYPDFSDRDVEKASFLRLDYLTLSYDFKMAKMKGFEGVNVYLTAQNLFTITSYTGLDPEVRLEDRNVFSPYDYRIFANPYRDFGDPLVPGMDRRNTYPSSRTFVVGVKLSL